MSDTFFENLLTQTCIVKSRVYNQSSIGDWGVPSEVISTTSASEKCLIQQNAENIEITIRGKKELATHIGFFKPNAVINLDDVIELDGISYQVIGVDNVMMQGHHLEILLKKIENKN